MAKKESTEKAVRDIRRRTRRRFSAEEKIRVVIEGLRGEESIASGSVRASSNVWLRGRPRAGIYIPSGGSRDESDATWRRMDDPILSPK